ncbi:MFS transporter [Catenulispora rubra]|uniref:MFS transporter n=1 Tax=Catenulispora rubra TaxID=280293 RepID=UPI001891FC18|nr:MFS transporter [Catenulispora rubra]
MTATALEPTGEAAMDTTDVMPEDGARAGRRAAGASAGTAGNAETAESAASTGPSEMRAARNAETTGSGEMSAARNAEAPASAETAGPAELIPLRRNRNFNLLWGGAVSAMLGLSTADIAYPLVILALTGSPLKAGLFATVQLIASVLATLPVGQLMDRKDRRRLLLLAESLRVVASGSVAVAYFLGALTFWHLLLTAAALGAIQPFAGARTLLLRQVVAPEQIPAALTAEQVRQQGCELAGPPLGGALFGISRALPFLFAMVAGLVSLLTVVLLKLPKSVTLAADQAGDAAGTGADTERGGALLGLKTIMRDPVMRATTLALCLVNTAGYPVFLSLVVRMHQQHAASGTTGLVIGAMALGGLVGTVLVKPLHKVMRPGWLLIVACLVFAVANFGMTFVAAPAADAAFLALSGAVIPSAVVMVNVLILQAVPDEERGRTSAALNMFLLIGMPAGMLVASAALQWFSPTGTLLGLSLLMTVPVLYSVSQKALRAAQWPDAQ